MAWREFLKYEFSAVREILEKESNTADRDSKNAIDDDENGGCAQNEYTPRLTVRWHIPNLILPIVCLFPTPKI